MNTKTSLAVVSTSALAAGMAHGGVIYSGPLNLQQNYGAVYRQGVDITGDGTNDFVFGYEANAQKPYIDARTFVGTDVPGQSGTSGIISVLTKTGSTGLPVTPGGTVIDATYATAYPASTTQRGYMYEDGNQNPGAGDWSNTSITEGYVGIELALPGGTSYGWLQFIDNPVTTNLTLVDWAYQSTPGVGLETGVIPEASVGALSALGLAGFLASRRRR